MLKIRKKHPLLTVAALGAICTTSAFAGTTTTPETVAPVEPPASVVSGTLSLQANTHFISYGADVWGSGSEWNDMVFNPSIELGIDLGSGFKLILGTWMDINDNVPSDIGGRVQEVDFWTGIGYTTGKWSFTLLYQAWLYASDTEQIVDFKIAYDTVLNPSLTIHGRPDAGASGGDEGVVVVVGVAEGFEAGPVKFNFPVNVAYATDGFHGGDAGFAYASAAVTASIPLSFLPGSWSLDTGLTGYYTSNDVLPKNADDTFVVGSAGLTLSF